ncbi:HAD family hydrolase [Desulfobulbus sp.]|uniref:HAD family hydrolase n=1 Tax=Desulfobulbus sp. TaxID=895 RepID=UPI00286EDE63|nr:HAD family hydrolase [Desulfobulbus sp.]
MPTSSSSSAAQSAVNVDDAGDWFPENLARINARLMQLAAHSSVARPAAVFDFDNTCIFRDVGQAVFCYQLQHLHYRLAPEQLAAILPRPEGQLAGRPLAAIVATLVQAYRTLFPLLLAGRTAKALSLPEARIFAALLLWFTIQARKDERLGPLYVLPFMAKLLAGFTTVELRFLAMDVVQAAGLEPLDEATLSAEAPAPIGRIEASYPRGLHPYPEMLALMRRLAGLGIERYVISASAEWLVEGAASWLGFPVEAERVFGIRVGLDAGEVLTISDPLDYPVTYREGKTEVIRRWIGSRPMLVAGDADTDYEMLTLPEVDLRLLLNRRQRGLIATLYEERHVLVQGLDLATGRFRPARESI